MEQLLQNPNYLALLLVWLIPWKGWALWRAAQQNSKVWFVVLLVVQTVGILEILYIFVLSKQKKVEGQITT